MKTDRHHLAAAAFAFALAAGAPLYAPAQQENGMPKSDVFGGADKNHDGRLSEDEYRAMQKEQQGATQEEPGKGLPATKHQASLVKPFKDIDTNHDGYIDADEMIGKPKD